MCERIIETSKKISPFVAKIFGLQPSFVTALFIVLGGMMYLGWEASTSLDETNKLLAKQLEISNKTLEELGKRVSEHDKRLGAVESKLDLYSADSYAERMRTNEALTHLNTKLDMVTYDIRTLNNVMLTKKTK